MAGDENMKCAYCGREARGTKEHIISSGILDLFPEWNTPGSDPIKNGNLFESRKGFFFWTGYAYSPKSVVDAMLKELIYTQERIL